MWLIPIISRSGLKYSNSMYAKRAEIMGIDVGGSKILLQTFDKKMEIVDEARIATQTKGGQKGFRDQLFELIEDHLHRGIKAIGIAVPGIVNIEKGLLAKAPHLPTKKDYPLKKLVEGRFGRRVYIDNDLNAFLWAEKERPVLQKYRNIVAVMVGTGVGGAIMNEGRLIYGASGFAGEVGHMIIRADSTLKSLEQNCGGSYMPKVAAETKAETDDARDPKIRKHVLEHLGIGLSNLNLIFNPEVIVLGGSVYRYHLAKDKKHLERMIAAGSLDKRGPKIIDAGKDTSVALGIAMLARQG